MSKGRVVKGAVEIRYDSELGEGRTVQYDDITVGGMPIKTVLRSIMNDVHCNVEAAKPELKRLLIDLFDTIWDLPLSTDHDLVFRDAADRVHEVFVSGIWNFLSTNMGDEPALSYMFWAFEVIGDWERATPGKERYIHKGTPFFFAAISALRRSNVDLGFLLLEAGEEVDRTTYVKAGRLGEEVSRPGNLTLRLDPNPNNALGGVVMELRRICEGRLKEFSDTIAQSGFAPLSMPDFDRYFLQNANWRSGTKFWVYHLFWSKLMVTDLNAVSVPRGGAFGRRRQSEVLLGILTTVEEILRQVDGTHGPRDRFVSVISEICSRYMSGSPKSDDVEKALSALTKGFGENVDKCLAHWSSPKSVAPTTAFPWYLQWIEPGRFLRNQVAHILDAPDEVQTRWADIERVVVFALFSAVWLFRDRSK